jgi:8-oxo-dGTP diphosphatase
MTEYVVGFLFSADFERVVLIRKKRPKWQRGQLNGVGGKLEDGESVYKAIARECREECGLRVSAKRWRCYLKMEGVNLDNKPFRVFFMAAVGNPAKATATTDEAIEVVYVRDISPLRSDLVENVCWTIALAIDSLQDGQPDFTKATYSRK